MGFFKFLYIFYYTIYSASLVLAATVLLLLLLLMLVQKVYARILPSRTSQSFIPYLLYLLIIVMSLVKNSCARFSTYCRA